MKAPKDKREVLLTIAKDVLGQMYMIKATRRHWLKLIATDNPDITLPNELQEVVPIIRNRRVRCEVCAIGACLLSYAKLYNETSLEGTTRSSEYLANYGNAAYVVMEKRIGYEAARLIELAYECGGGWNTKDYTDAMEEAAVAFGQRYADDGLRLRAIMENIVRNNGIFDPLEPQQEKVTYAETQTAE